MNKDGLLGAFAALIVKMGGSIELSEEDLLKGGSGKFEIEVSEDYKLIIKVNRLGESGEMQKLSMLEEDTP